MNTQEVINRIIQETGIYVSKNRLYNYIELGIVPEPKRDSNEYRVFSESDYERLKLVVMLTDLNVPLKHIKNYSKNKAKDLIPILIRKEVCLADVMREIDR